MSRIARSAMVASCAALPLGTGGCAVVNPTVVGTPHGGLERARAFCGARTALGHAHATLPARVPRGPGCRRGALCSLSYTTRDRAGLLAATATSYIFQWRVSFDLQKPGITAADVPLVVQQV